jgi:HK97 family phage prohead protease
MPEKIKEKIELRTFNVELRADDTKPKQFIGYAAMFDVLSENLEGFREKIQPGAFAKSIVADDVRCLFNHDTNYVLGRNTNGTLILEEDDVGLKITVTPPDTQFAKDLVTLVERGDITQMSFGFVTNVEEWDTSGEEIIRTLIELKLYDVSLVVYPYYKTTIVGVRSSKEILDEFQASQRQELEAVENKKKAEVLTQERNTRMRNVRIAMVKGEI